VRAYEGHVRIQRGGRTVRVFTLILYSKQASSLLEDEIHHKGTEKLRFEGCESRARRLEFPQIR
jgi:hypothetical protein